MADRPDRPSRPMPLGLVISWECAAFLLRHRPIACPWCAASTVAEGGFGGPAEVPDPAITFRGRIEPNRLTNTPPAGGRRAQRLRPDNHETIEGPQVTWSCARCGLAELLALVNAPPGANGIHWKAPPESDRDGP